MELSAFILASFGITKILVHGRIFRRVRPRYYAFHCSMCTGFWVGIVLSLIPNPLFSFEKDFATGFFLGCISSGTSYLLCQIIDDDGIKIKKGDSHA